MKTKIFLSALLLSGLLVQLPFTAPAEEKTWTGANSTDWYSPWNWSPEGVPAATDRIIINSGPIEIAHEFTASNWVTWNDGAISGLLTVAKGAELRMGTTGSKSFSGTLGNAGTIRFYGPGWDGGRLGLVATASYSAPGIRNEAGALFEFGDNQSIYGCSTAWFANAGTLRKFNGPGTTQLGEPGLPLAFANTGTVEVGSGSLSFWSYTDSQTANVAIHLLHPMSPPRMTFVTTPTFLGQLTVQTYYVFALLPGATHEVLKYPSAAIGFIKMNGLEARGGVLLDPVFSPTNLVLRVIWDGNYKVIHRFGWPSDGGLSPLGRVLEGCDGMLYFTTWRGGGSDHGALYKMKPDGSGFQKLHDLLGYAVDAGLPWCGVIQGSDGMLYGTTMMGGLIPMPPDYNGMGAVYRVDTNGSNYAVLHSFTGSDGATPRAEVLQASDGWLYGTTEKGGVSDGGTVFRMRTNGSDFAVLHHFTGAFGFFPQAPLVEGKDGLLYGSTPYGLFKMSKDGTYIAGAPGLGSWAPVTIASNGLIYGTAPWIWPGSTEKGKVFCGTPGGVVVLHNFTGPDGCHPGNAPVIEGPDGRLYGTTVRGGANDLGVLYRLEKNGTRFKVLHHFRGPPHDGQLPMSGLTLNQKRDGLYGTARGDEDADRGIVFRYGHSLSMGVGHGASGGSPGPSGGPKDLSDLRVTLQLSGIPDLAYRLQRSTNLIHWTNLWSGVMPESLLVEYEDPAPPPAAAFYRLNLVR